MIKIKKTLLILLIILLLSFPVSAINGHISLGIDTMSGNGLGEIYLYEKFDRLTIGGMMQTDLMGFTLKDGYFPAGVPRGQSYDLIVKYDITEQIEVSLVEGCKHYFAQSNKTRFDDDVYIKINLKYSF